MIITGRRHWILAEIDPQQRKITTYDSLMTYTERYYDQLLDRLARNLQMIGILEKSYEVCKQDDCSQQSNSVDCGIMALIFLRNILQGRKTDMIGSAQAKSFRLQFAETLLRTTEHGEALLLAHNNNIVDVLKFCCDHQISSR